MKNQSSYQPSTLNNQLFAPFVRQRTRFACPAIACDGRVHLYIVMKHILAFSASCFALHVSRRTFHVTRHSVTRRPRRPSRDDSRDGLGRLVGRLSRAKFPSKSVLGTSGTAPAGKGGVGSTIPLFHFRRSQTKSRESSPHPPVQTSRPGEVKRGQAKSIEPGKKFPALDSLFAPVNNPSIPEMLRFVKPDNHSANSGLLRCYASYPLSRGAADSETVFSSPSFHGSIIPFRRILRWAGRDSSCSSTHQPEIGRHSPSRFPSKSRPVLTYLDSARPISTEIKLFVRQQTRFAYPAIARDGGSTLYIVMKHIFVRFALELLTTDHCLSSSIHQSINPSIQFVMFHLSVYPHPPSVFRPLHLHPPSADFHSSNWIQPDTGGYNWIQPKLFFPVHGR